MSDTQATGTPARTPQTRVIAWCPWQRRGRANPKHVDGDYHLVKRGTDGAWEWFTVCGLSISFLMSRADAKKWRFASEGQAATCPKCIARTGGRGMSDEKNTALHVDYLTRLAQNIRDAKADERGIVYVALDHADGEYIRMAAEALAREGVLGLALRDMLDALDGIVVPDSAGDDAPTRIRRLGAQRDRAEQALADLTRGTEMNHAAEAPSDAALVDRLVDVSRNHGIAAHCDALTRQDDVDFAAVYDAVLARFAELRSATSGTRSARTP